MTYIPQVHNTLTLFIMGTRYKPVIRNQPQSFWSKYIENRREREKQQQQQLKKPLNINNNILNKRADEEIHINHNEVKKKTFGTTKSNTEEVPKLERGKERS